MSDTVQALVQIGAIQFGQFEAEPGSFDPVAFHLGLLASYPSILRALAHEIAPLVRIDGLTHVLAAPSAMPIGVALGLATEMPLVYPSGETVEGAYDFNVPTILLTDVLTDGAAESALIKHVKPLGLDVKAVVGIINFDIPNSLDVPIATWRNLRELLSEITTLTPFMRKTVENWLDERVTKRESDGSVRASKTSP